MADLDAMQEKLDELSERVAKVEGERDRYRELYQQTLEQCRKPELGLRGQKSESLGEDGIQMSLEMLEMVLGERAKAEVEDLAAETQTVSGARALP